MARPVRKNASISPPARVVLNWLASQPARVYDFSEVATGTRLKRPVAQRAISELRHPRSGGFLKDTGPDGLKLRLRHAFLPKDSEARDGIPQPEHPEFEPAEHPSVTAIRNAQDDLHQQQADEDAVRQSEITERGRVVRQQKLQRRLALAKQRQADGTERDEAVGHVPTLEEVIEAGYSPATAAGIVAEHLALSEGKTPDEAERIGALAHNEATEREAAVTTADAPPDGAYLSDDEVDAALNGDPEPDDADVNGHEDAYPDSEHDLAPADTGEENFEPKDADDADLEAATEPLITESTPATEQTRPKSGKRGKK